MLIVKFISYTYFFVEPNMCPYVYIYECIALCGRRFKGGVNVAV